MCVVSRKLLPYIALDPFIADFALSDCDNIKCFVALSDKLCSALLLARKTCWQRLRLIGTHCGHILLGGMIRISNSRCSH